MKNFKWMAIAPIALVCFTMNPAMLTGCSGASSNKSFGFGEAQMQQLVLGTWQGEAVSKDGKIGQVSLEVKQATKKMALWSWVQSAHACGTRTFIRSASACIDTTEMPVTATMTITQKGADGQVSTTVNNLGLSGRLMVAGRQMNNAMFSLKGGDVTLNMSSNDGQKFEPGSLVLNKDKMHTLKLKRIAAK